jgi:pimeloyl-ACP methyl ester carboxylesterase
VRRLLLIHGGVGSDPMTAERFWVRPGVVAALAERGVESVSPDRALLAGSWDAELAHVAAAIRAAGVTKPLPVLSGSNGTTVALLLALRHPELVSQLILAWPATAGDDRVDALQRKDFLENCGFSPGQSDALLAGRPIRGVSEAELATLDLPVTVLRSLENPYHQGITADALLKSIPGSVEIGSPCPESPRPDFPDYLASFADSVSSALPSR